MGLSTPTRREYRCCCAVNLLYDREREQRSRMPESERTEQAWQPFHERINREWPDHMHEHCGKLAQIFVIGMQGHVYSYCRECFCRDMGVVNGQICMIALPTLTPDDRKWIEESLPNCRGITCRFINWDNWERALELWRVFELKTAGALV